MYNIVGDFDDADVDIVWRYMQFCNFLQRNYQGYKLLAHS